MRKCIVRNKDGFEVVNLKKEDSLPPNHAISPKSFNTGLSNSFQLAENNIRIVWMNGSRDGHHVRFLLNEIELNKINSPQIQSVCDYLNKFSSLSKSELSDLVSEAQQSKKSIIEKELAELELKRDSIKKEISELKVIIKKKDEIFTQLSELLKQSTHSGK